MRARTKIASRSILRPLAAAVVLAGLLAAGCGGGGSESQASPVKPMRLSVMEFNIEYGGTLVSFDKVVAAVRAADPDVVGLEEAETHTGRLAKALDYPYFNNGMQIVSKYPILEPSGAKGVYAFVEVQPGRVVAISNVHLPSDPYGPNWIRDGKSVQQVLALERRLRLPAIQQQVEVLPPLARGGVPTFVVGDFNAPSHLDYTAAAVGTRKEISYVVPWPVSEALTVAGFRDSYREAHPDPVQEPGLTWWAGRPKVVAWASNPTVKDPQDRIDQIYAAGPARTVSSTIVGEKGHADVTVSVTPWPSDHRAVVSTFEVTPAPMPVMVATNKPLLAIGQQLEVTYRRPAGDGQYRVELVPATGASGSSVASKTAGDLSGVVSFATGGLSLTPGAYEAVLTKDADLSKALARTPFWLKQPGAPVTLTTDKATYAVGEPITVTWGNAPANRWDWIGVYNASAADPSTDYYLIWQYTGGAMAGTVHGMPAGTLRMDGDTTEGSPWPLPAGKYVVYYLLADAYDWVAKASFTVTR
jgi:endonuclease/exonuclease/phosphatase family metal-dependent hydrolase